MKKKILGLGLAALAVCCAVLLGTASPASAADCPWMSTVLTPQARATMLLGAMNLDQKIHMVAGNGSSVGTGAGSIGATPELCIPALGLADGAGGLGNGNTGITAFPAPVGQAAAFDTATQKDFGVALGQEFIAKGENQWLAPNVNMARYPLNGRTFEGYGEDPYLSGQTAANGIQGAQSQHVIGTVKHYLANNSELNRFYESSTIDERTMREIYLPAFETAVKQGGSASVMCAYNRINEIYACENDAVLNGILKSDWGFDGFVVSDWIAATHSPQAALAGLDMEMPFALGFNQLKTAVQLGVVPQARLDNMVSRILFSMFKTGLFDYPVAQPSADVSTTAHQALAQKMTTNGMVLLKNAGSLLPLTGKNLKLAVIGDVDQGGAANVCSGGGSAVVDCSRAVPPLDAITARAAKAGYTVTFDDGTDTASAAATAAAANVAIVFGYYNEAEFSNRSSLALDGNGNDLIAAVAGAQPKTAVVLMTGGPATMPWLGSVASVLEAWYPGVAMGNAIAAVLFGDANPSGHLPITFPVSESDLPTAASPERQNDESPELIYSEKLEIGYRWFDQEGIQPLFPFGYGLSYTTFAFKNPKVTGTPANGVKVEFTLKNTGKRAGADVAQVYVGFPAAAGEPPRQLKGYQRTQLGPGAETRVSITLDRRAFSSWDTATHSWVLTPGCYVISVGDSSRSLPLSTQVC